MVLCATSVFHRLSYILIYQFLIRILQHPTKIMMPCQNLIHNVYNSFVDLVFMSLPNSKIILDVAKLFGVPMADNHKTSFIIEQVQ